MEEKQPADDDANDLETLDTSASNSDGVIDASTGGSDSSSDDGGDKKAKGKSPLKGSGGIRGLLSHINIYLLGFILLLVIAGGGGGVVYLNGNKKANEQGKIKSQTLTSDSLKQLANSDVTVGDSQQVLTVQSSAIFDGPVLFKGNVEVAGKLITSGGGLGQGGGSGGGKTSLQNLGVSSNLSIGHDLRVSGNAVVQGSLSVKGDASFQNLAVGSLTVSSLRLTSALQLTQHLIVAGSTPSRSSGGALGDGGTTSVSGSDTAGSIRVNTGGNPATGCFVTVNFTQTFNTTPHVVVTPVGSAAGGLQYYVNRTTSSFSVCSASKPPSGASFGFDYIVIG